MTARQTVKTFPDGETWYVSATRERGRSIRMDVKVTLPSQKGDRKLVVVGQVGNPFDPQFLERFAAHGASRNGASSAVYAERLVSIADALFPWVSSSSSSPTAPRGASDDDDALMTGMKPISLSEMAPSSSRQWSVMTAVPMGRISGFFGTFGTLKSQTATYLAICVATGLPFFGHAVQKAPVLFLDYEEDASEAWRRAHALTRGLGLEHIPEGLDHLEVSDPLHEIAGELGELIRGKGYGLIVLDSIGPALAGDPDSAEIVIPTYESMRNLGATWFVIDHESKVQTTQRALSQRTPFGSVYKAALSRSLISVVAPDKANHPSSIILQHQKSSYAPPMEPLALKARWEADAMIFSHGDWAQEPFKSVRDAVRKENGKSQKKQSAQDLVFDAVKGGVESAESIADITKLAVGTVKNKLTELGRIGKVARKPDGKYAPAAAQEAK